MQPHNRKASFQIVVGIVVMLMPILGFPFAWEATVQYILGVAIIILALPFSLTALFKIMFSRSKTCQPIDSSDNKYQNPSEKNPF